MDNHYRTDEPYFNSNAYSQNYFNPSAFQHQNTYVPQPNTGQGVSFYSYQPTPAKIDADVPSYDVVSNSAITGIAVQYGSTVVGQGANFVQKNVEGYLSSSRLKYYFAVNNSYVAKKLGLILFPFAHTKWSSHFDPSGPVPPGDDINAPDLYIPFMAFITYILASGAIMGVQNRFSPEHLGIMSSEALGWLALEFLILFLCIYILNIQSNVSYLDLIAFSGYKFVSMIVILGAYLFLDQAGYYFALLYVSAALAFLLIRTLKHKVLPHAEAYPSECNKRRIYFLLMIAIIQPFLMWWLTRRMIFSSVSTTQAR